MQLKQTDFKLPFQSLLLIAPFFLWGTAMVAMKGVLPQTTPLFVASVRLLPAGLLILLFTTWQGRPQPRSWKAWLSIAIFAVVDGILFQGFLAEGLTRTGAGLGSVMIDSQPLAVAILSLWLFQDRIGFWGWLGLVIGVGGISLIGLPDELILNGFNLETAGMAWGVDRLFQSGEWLMLLASLSMAVGTVLVRWVCRHCDPVVATGWHMILAGVPLLAVSLGLESGQWTQLGSYDWLALGYSTIFGSAIAYGLFFYFASSGSLTSLSSLTFLTPVFALLFGNLFLGEVLSPVQSLGVGFTLVSIYLVNQRDTLAEKLKFNRSEEQSDSSEGQQRQRSKDIPVEVRVREAEPKL